MIVSPLLDALGPDAADRPLSELLLLAAREFDSRGGGPLGDCLARKAEQVAAAESSMEAQRLGEPAVAWPSGMQSAAEFIGEAASYYRESSGIRGKLGEAAPAAHLAALNATVCQLAPAVLSIADSLATLVQVAQRTEEQGLRICPGA